MDGLPEEIRWKKINAHCARAAPVDNVYLLYVHQILYSSIKFQSITTRILPVRVRGIQTLVYSHAVVRNVRGLRFLNLP